MEKIKTILLSLLLMTILPSLSSCSDKEDEPSVPAARSVAGTYQGDMTSSVMGQESVFENMTFTLNATDDSTVSLVISTFGNPPMQVPEITIPGIKVSGENGTYTLAATEFSQEANGKKCSGVVRGNFANNTLEINFNLQYGAMPMPMICSFSAQK